MTMLLALSQPAIKPEFSYRYQNRRSDTHDFVSHVPSNKPRFASPRPPSRGGISRASPRLASYSGLDSAGVLRDAKGTTNLRLPATEPLASYGPSSTASNLSSSVESNSSLDRNMSDRHRGLAALPPPSSMTLPDPRSNQQLQASYSAHHSSYGPSAPQISHNRPQSQQGYLEDSAGTQTWYTFRAEEERRKQEEERTRQETIRLEQRKIEAGMLHDALAAGIPPPMIPMIYAGLGSNYLAAGSGGQEWMQQLVGQFQTLAASSIQQVPHSSAYAAPHQSMMQHPQSHPSPRELRHEPRVPVHQFSHPTHAQVLPSQPLDTSAYATYSAYHPTQAPTSVPRSAAHAQLPRLTTQHDPYSPPPSQGSAHPMHHGQAHGDPTAATSPNIFFHHWQPPNDAKVSDSKPSNNPPQTTNTRNEPGSHSKQSNQTADSKETPRKRKAQGGHHPNPPPSSSGASHTSPTFSTASLPSTSGGGRNTTGRKRSVSGATEHLRTRSSVSVGPREDENGSAVAPAAAVATSYARPTSRRDAPEARDSHLELGSERVHEHELNHSSERRPASRAHVSWTKFRPLHEETRPREQLPANEQPSRHVVAQQARPRSH